MVTKQASHKHHYVPDWYQRRFLPDGQTAFQILDLHPQVFRDPKSGAVRGRSRSIFERGPASWFYEKDLYTVRAFGQENDDIERHLFGRIDREGQAAVDALVGQDFDKLHFTYDRFFEFLDALRLRTPKGLRFVQTIAQARHHHDLLLWMQHLRTMHCVMWGEGAREIVTADNSSVKFIFSDHPVTFYNRYVFPADPSIPTGLDPLQAWKGTQTLFPLDRNRLAIITHKEWARSPLKRHSTRPRTNARMFDNPMIWYHDWILNRSLTEEQVAAVNYIIKTRAERYIAGPDEEHLFPERRLKSRMWDRLAPFLLPEGFHVAPQEGYTMLQTKDGKWYFQDEYGRRPTSKAEYEAEVERAKRMKAHMERLLREHAAKKRSSDAG
jgi:hypothetical protein